ncbi:MAG: ribosome maturation factor RimM [Anaerolineae bacterium]
MRQPRPSGAKPRETNTDRQGSGEEQHPEPSYVVVGRVRRPHGIGGELRVEILTDYPERIAQHNYLYLARPRNPDDVDRYPLQSVRPHKDILLVKLGGCSDRDAAENLRGMLVQVPMEEAVPLEDGEYYHFQLIGMDVETETGEWLGRVADVMEAGAHDVYVVRGPRGEILLPAVEDVILKLDLEARDMIVHILPGMLEEG